MKNLQLINDDYLGYVKRLRHACRGIVVKDGKVLLSYETKYNKYMIPGGGVEEGENYAECCERELLEETGIKVRCFRFCHGRLIRVSACGVVQIRCPVPLASNRDAGKLG